MANKNKPEANVFWEKVEQFLKKYILNKKVFLSSVLVIVVLLTLTVVYVMDRDKKKREIKTLYAQAFYDYKSLFKDDKKKITIDSAKKAIANLNIVIKKGYTSFNEYYAANYNLGNIYKELNELDSAKKYYLILKEASHDFPFKPLALINLGKIAQSKNNCKEANKIYSEIHNSYNNSYKDYAYYLKGICYEKLKNEELALSSYKMVRKDSEYKEKAKDAIEIINKLKGLAGK